MKILMVNKFLHPNGGSETYIFKLGAALAHAGHQVQYFGMEHQGRCVGNRVDAYTSDMDFHNASKLEKLTYPLKTIYSREARQKISLVLNDFQPDVVHLNNFNYQLTPSIILEIRAWEKKNGRKVKIVFTAHDYQLLCPNHMCNNPATRQNCEKCLGGNFMACVTGKCIHGSLAKSAIGATEAMFWNANGVYRQIDTMVCPSLFLKSKFDIKPLFKSKAIMMYNFIEDAPIDDVTKKDYVLYFGRLSKEKGIETLIAACKNLPNINFVFVGSGPLVGLTENIMNIKNVGFQTNGVLKKLICEARFSVCPSEWYEVFGLTIGESIVCGTPVLGANIGAIPELIQDGKTGELFESGNQVALQQAIETLWNDKARLQQYSENCKNVTFDTVTVYTEKLLELYQ